MEQTESKRREVLNDLYARLDAARNSDNPHAWREAMMQLLPLLSDDQIRDLSQLIEAYDQVIEVINSVCQLADMPCQERQEVENAYIHSMPEVVQ